MARGGEEIMAAVEDATSPAGAPAAPSDDDKEASSCEPDELTGGSGTGNASVREPKDVGIGLSSAEWILRSPNSKEPVIIRRADLTGVSETEAVLTGGLLLTPVLLQDLTVVDDIKFTRLNKAWPTLCLFLTGEHPRKCPLKNVAIFTQMKERMHKHRSALVAVAETVLKATRDAKDEMILGPVSKGRQPGKRAHKREKNTLLLPEYDAVDMGLGMRQWAPTVLIRPGDANVSMEVTTENFQALFDIVQTQLAEPFTEGGVAGMPKRQVRPKSDPRAPIHSPRGTRYWIDS